MIGIGATLKERFNLTRELGKGGMGIVYQARDGALDRDVAIKVLKNVDDPTVAKKIRLEAQITARLEHPHIIRLYDIDETDATTYIVMEMVRGSSFQSRLRAMSLADRLRVVLQAAEALDYAHQQGVIHRDVKPANILLDDGAGAKLSDFGLSIRADAVQSSKSVQGTPLYMSPEQAQGKKVDFRTDLYALGVILYECVAGSPPFTGSIMAVMSQHIGAEPEPLLAKIPGTDPDLARLTHSLLSKAMEERPADGKSVVKALQNLLGAKPAIKGAPQFESVSVTSLAPPSFKAPLAAAGSDAGAPPSSPGSGSIPPSKTGSSLVESHPLARELAEVVEAGPLAITPEQRFLAGHYLAYLLGGSRKRGIFGSQRPTDGRNADSARLLLAMPAITLRKGSDAFIAKAAELIDKQIEVRPLLSPAVVIKYLLCRTPNRIKKFREYRDALRDQSAYAREHLVDENGALNTGVMPQKLDDLWITAPKDEVVDDKLVERWNKLTEIWRTRPGYRHAVLKYATLNAHKDPASIGLWPEVVYPLLERAKWQQKRRTVPQKVWEQVGGRLLRVPEAAAGPRFEREVRLVVPKAIIEHIDRDIVAFEQGPQEGEDFQDVQVRRLAADVAVPVDQIDPDRVDTAAQERLANVNQQAVDRIVQETDGTGERDEIALEHPDAYRFMLGELRELYNEAAQSLSAPRGPGQTLSNSASDSQKQLRIGPYRLDVVPSYRGRSAGEVVVLGPGCRIEMHVPSIKLSNEQSQRLVVALWLYVDNSLLITHLDQRNQQQYIFWYAPLRERNVFEDLGQVHHALLERKLEVPDQVNESLTKKYRPVAG